MDLRGHGKSVTDDDLNLSIEVCTLQFGTSLLAQLTTFLYELVIS